MIYPSSKEDFIPVHWSKADYESQLQILEDTKSYLAVTDRGFARLTLMGRIVNFIKGLLGGTDESSEERTTALMFKFLYYGEAHDLLNSTHLRNLKGRISSLNKNPIALFFSTIENFHRSSGNKSKHLKELREKTISYHRQVASSLRPGFWTCRKNPPTLNPKDLIEFGDTPLQLFAKAYEDKKPEQAFDFLKNAFALKNDKPEFQKKLGDQLKKLEDSQSPALKNQTKKIQKLWFELGKTAFDNNLPALAKTYFTHVLGSDNTKLKLKVGKLYLIHHFYADAMTLLPSLEKAHEREPKILTEIGHAYWEGKKYPEAIAVYEKVLKCNYDSWLHYRIGKAYLDNLVPAKTDHLKLAIESLSQAFLRLPAAAEDLYSAYQQFWNSQPDPFITASLQGFLTFLSHAQNGKKWEATLPQILLGCADKLFKQHHNKLAHACLNELIRLYPTQDSFKIEVITLALLHQDVVPLTDKIHEWNRQKQSDPKLKKLIGDVLWKSSKTEAKKTYEEAFIAFQSKQGETQDVNLKTDYQKKMGEIRAILAQDLLQTQPGLFRGIPFDQAIAQLENAASHDPAHQAALFEAYMKAAEAEKQRTFILKDLNKVINYYQKAFNLLAKEGPYLIELLTLYLDNSRQDEAIALYQTMQKQSWGSSFQLPADLSNRLGHSLSDQGHQREAISCFKHAYTLDPSSYKKDYFEITFGTFKDFIPKQNQDLPKLAEAIALLKECWKEGFDYVQKLQKPFEDLLIRFYLAQAKIALSEFLVPSNFTKTEIGDHLKKNKEAIKKIVTTLEDALEIAPKSSMVHFELGLLYDFWLGDYTQAFSYFEKAAANKPENSFYQWYLGNHYYIVKSNPFKKEEHHKKAEEYSYPSFSEDRILFEQEILFKTKTKEIDPHTPPKKGWLF